MEEEETAEVGFNVEIKPDTGDETQQLGDENKVHQKRLFVRAGDVFSYPDGTLGLVILSVSNNTDKGQFYTVRLTSDEELEILDRKTESLSVKSSDLLREYLATTAVFDTSVFAEKKVMKVMKNIGDRDE